MFMETKKTSRRKKRVPVETPKMEIKKIKLLIIIVDRGQAIKYIRENEKHDVTTQMVLLGHGTAGRVLADYLGLGDVKKDVILSIIKEEKVDEILQSIEHRLTLSSHKGIAFTVSISSMIGVSLYKFLTKTPIEQKGGLNNGK